MKHKKHYALLAAAVMSWLAMPVFAESTPGGGSNDQSVTTKDVVVEANRAKEEAKYESQSTTVITSEDIARKQGKSVEDVIFNETGVTRTVDAMGRVGIAIRGADARHTLIMVDGQPVLGDVGKFNGNGDELMRLGAENIDRIEIVRGAATAKYGADAIGGVVNVITKAPKDKMGFQLNAETSYHTSWHDSTEASSALPSNWFMRADTGKIGKLKVAAWASKRDILPVYDSKYQWGPNVTGYNAETGQTWVGNWYEKFKPTLRYYGDVKNTGVAGEYAFNDKQKISFNVSSEREDTERHNKNIWDDGGTKASYWEPMQNFTRNIRRDTYRFAWNGAAGNTDWQLDVSHGKMKEKDVAILQPYGQSTNQYSGTNQLYSVDWVEHEKTNVNLGLNTAVNDQHLLSYGFGYTKEKAIGSRIKDAPKSYYQTINPWDYNQSLEVTDNTASASDKPKTYIHDYKLKDDGEHRKIWDKDGEIYGGATPVFSAVDMQAKPTGGQTNAALLAQYENFKAAYGVDDDTILGILPIKPDDLKKYNEFKQQLMKENPNYQLADKTDDDGNPIKVNDIVFRYYGANNVTGNGKYDGTENDTSIKYNGKAYYEDYFDRDNRLQIGEAEVKRTYAYIQDAWQVNDNTLLLPSLRIDHSDLFGSKVTGNMGMTHNLNGNPHRRLKANFGTAYAEPGLGEMYYNWEMYGGTMGTTGWYWKGNPNLKPEESFNMDVSLEGENDKTYGRVGLFHNEIKNYMTSYFTGKYYFFNTVSLDDGTTAGDTFTFSGDRVYSFRNVGKAKITGLEAEVQQKFNDKWSAKFGYTWLYAIQNSDSDMPKRLLDRPQHKFDISLNYNDKNAGFRGALWGSYYMNMLDSNSISNEDMFLQDDNGNDIGRKVPEYKKKSFGIWNLLLEKDLDPDTTVYAGIDNLFNHRDDDRAYNDRVYRFGVNVKFDDLGKTLFGDNTPHFKKDGNGNVIITNKYGDDWFLKRTVDTTRKAGTVDVYGDYRVRSNMIAGDRYASPMRSTRTAQPTAAAVANASRKSNHGLEQRLRFGVDYQIADGLNLDVAGATSKRDTSYDVADKRGLHDPYLEKAELTKSTNKWDWTIGRIHEPMGVTGYWFGKEYDGARVMYTDKKTQVTVGYGDFSQTTGITNSAYNHKKRTTISRPPTWSELLGVYGYLSTDPITNITTGGANKYDVAFDANAKANYLEKFNYANGLQHKDANGNWVKNDGVTDVQVAEAKLKVLQELTGVLKNLSTASGQWEAFSKSPMVGNFFTTSQLLVPKPNKPGKYNTVKNGIHIQYKKADGNIIDYRNNPSYSIQGGNYLEKYGFEKGLESENIRTELGNIYDKIASDNGSSGTFVDDSGNELSREDAINQMFVGYVGGDAIYTKDNGGLRNVANTDQLKSYNALNMFFFNLVDGGAIGTKLNPLSKTDIDYGTANPPIPLFGYGLDDTFKVEGDLLVNDVIPAMDRAAFIKVRRQISDNIGVEAWKLNSFGDAAHDDQGRELKIADVIGIGAKVRLGEKSMFSFDYGQNRSDMGKYFHGGIGTYGEYKGGSTPDFWVARLDYGIADTNAPGSWNAYFDYKAFDHGSFLGGTGADLPDRYLDGIRSFTAGFGYVPARNLLLEASYTFDAHSTQKRDTLYTPEDFSLGDYTRVSLTYKF